MKKLGLIIAASLSMFLVACEEEVSTPSVVASCDMPEQSLCLEAANFSAEDQKDCAEEGGTIGVGCKSGEDLKCAFEEDGVKGEMFMYGENAKAVVALAGSKDAACAMFNEEE